MDDDLDVTSEGDGVHRVVGDLDAHSAGAFEAAFADIGGDVVLDLSGVGFADSSGLRVVLALHRRLESEGGSLRVGPVSQRVDRLLTLTGLDEVLHRI